MIGGLVQGYNIISILLLQVEENLQNTSNLSYLLTQAYKNFVNKFHTSQQA